MCTCGHSEKDHAPCGNQMQKIALPIDPRPGVSERSYR